MFYETGRPDVGKAQRGHALMFYETGRPDEEAWGHSTECPQASTAQFDDATVAQRSGYSQAMGPVLLAQVKVAAWTGAINYLASQGVNTATYQTDPSLAAQIFLVWANAQASTNIAMDTALRRVKVTFTNPLGRIATHLGDSACPLWTLSRRSRHYTNSLFGAWRKYDT